MEFINNLPLITEKPQSHVEIHNYIHHIVVCLWQCFCRTTGRDRKFIVTDINDKDSTLNKVRMFPPKFYRIGNGRRIEIKVCNEDSMQIRRVRCLLYYSGSGKRKCINKIWISPLEGNETYYFCMNIKLKLTKEEWSRLTFRIKRGKVTRTTDSRIRIEACTSAPIKHIKSGKQMVIWQKSLFIILVIITNWFGLVLYYFYAKDKIVEWMR